jgi:hypothetical protein
MEMNVIVFTHSSVSSSEVKNEQSCASTLPLYFDGIDIEKLSLIFLHICLSLYNTVYQYIHV